MEIGQAVSKAVMVGGKHQGDKEKNRQRKGHSENYKRHVSDRVHKNAEGEKRARQNQTVFQRFAGGNQEDFSYSQKS